MKFIAVLAIAIVLSHSNSKNPLLVHGKEIIPNTFSWSNPSTGKTKSSFLNTEANALSSNAISSNAVSSNATSVDSLPNTKDTRKDTLDPSIPQDNLPSYWITTGQETASQLEQEEKEIEALLDLYSNHPFSPRITMNRKPLLLLWRGMHCWMILMQLW